MWKRDQSDVPPAPAPAPPPEARPATSPSTEQAPNGLGQSVFIKGELSGSEDLAIHGQVEGSISLPNHALTVGVQATVKADITAKAVIVIGKITGKVTAAERIEIRASGSVMGDVSSPRLVIADGGNLRGKVEMTRS